MRRVALAAAVVLALGGVNAHASKKRNSRFNFKQMIPKGNVDTLHGAYDLQVPIKVPGFFGIEPPLGLAYQSQAGNGYVGVGWSLGGFSEIQRASVGKGAPRFDGADIFLLDGKELHPCPEPDPVNNPATSCKAGGTGVKFYEKGGGKKRIRHQTATADVWEVTAPDGTLTIYRINFNAPQGTYKWGIDTVTDTNGNAVDYDWYTGPGPDKESYPDQVSYGGVVVKFYREARPDDFMFGTGSSIGEMHQRITTITVKVNGAKLRAYQLNYKTDGDLTGRSLLAAVREFGNDFQLDSNTNNVASGTAWPASSFTYTGGTVGFSTTYANEPALGDGNWGVENAYSTIQLADVNGDGLDDLCGRSPSVGIRCWLSTGTGFQSTAKTGPAWTDGLATDWTLPEYYSTIQFPDIDGDGDQDVCARDKNGLTCRKWNEATNDFGTVQYNLSALSDASGWSQPDRYGTIQFADIDGDGDQDVCGKAATGIKCWRWNQNTNAWGTTPINGPVWDSAYGYAGTTTDWTLPKYYGTIRFADINGDGRTDVCGRAAHGIECRLMFWDGSDFGSNVVLGPNWNDAGGWDQKYLYSTIQFPDINGDGLADICARSNSGVVCYLSKGDNTAGGNNFTTQIDGPNWDNCTTTGCDATDWSLPEYYSTIQFSDINGDGMADVCGRTKQNGVKCYLAKEDSFPKFVDGPNWSDGLAVDWTAKKYYSTIQMGDVDGDSKADICARNDTGMICQVSKGDGVELLTRVDNPLGGYTVIKYAPSFTFDRRQHMPNIQVVSQVTKNDGRGWSSQTVYDYDGGTYNFRERRFMGFATVKVTSPCIQSETQCPYKVIQHRKHKGLVRPGIQKIEWHEGNGTLAKVRQIDWDNTTDDDDAINVDKSPYITKEKGTWNYAYDNAGVNYKVTYEEKAFDMFGNVVRTYDYGDYSTSADDINTEIVFVPNLATYVVNASARERTFAGTTMTTLLDEKQTEYDGNTTWNAMPTKGNSTRTLDWLDTGNRYITHRTGYNPNGTKAWDQDELARETDYTYDSTFPWLVRTADPPLLPATTTTYDPVCIAEKTSTDPNGKLTQKQYDALCRLARTDFPSGDYEAVTFRNFGSAQVDTQFMEIRKTAPAGRTEIYSRRYIDGLGRTWRRLHKNSEASSDDVCVDKSFAARTPLVDKKSLPYKCTGTAKWENNTWDQRNRKTAVTHPDGTSIQFSYGLWQKTTTDEALHKVRDTKDADGHMIAHEELLGSVWYKTTYDYDLRGRNTKVRDPRNQTTETYSARTSYDSLDRKIQLIDPDLGTVTSSYNDDGSLAFETVSGSGDRTEYGYDNLKRMTSKRMRAQSASPTTVTWSYDETAGRTTYGTLGLSGYANLGHKTSLTDPSGTDLLDYDDGGRLVHRKRTTSGTVLELWYKYDAGGRLLGAKLPDRSTLGDDPTTPTSAEPALEYDGAGRPSKIPGYVDAATYNDAGRLLTWQHDNRTSSNGRLLKTTYSYSANRSWTDRIQTTATSYSGTIATLQDDNYSHYNDGLTSSVTSKDGAGATIAGESWAYTYNDLHFLTVADNATSSYDRQYEYDEIGNVLSRTEGTAAKETYTYNSPRPHAVTQVGSTSYGYDADGQMLSGGGRTIAWGAERRPSSATAGGATLTFSYDADGARVKKVNGGATTYYIGDDYEVTGATATKQIKLNGSLVARQTGSTTTWLHAAQLGSVHVESNTNGGVVRRAIYAPYGQQLSGGLVGAPMYTAQREDEAIGLVYLHARYFDPRLARFISTDPVVNERTVGLNSYAYVGNDPIDNTDPTGEYVVYDGGGGGGGGGDSDDDTHHRRKFSHGASHGSSTSDYGDSSSSSSGDSGTTGDASSSGSAPDYARINAIRARGGCFHGNPGGCRPGLLNPADLAGRPWNGVFGIEGDALSKAWSNSPVGWLNIDKYHDTLSSQGAVCASTGRMCGSPGARMGNGIKGGAVKIFAAIGMGELNALPGVRVDVAQDGSIHTSLENPIPGIVSGVSNAVSTVLSWF